MGRQAYPTADALYITADAGGSNGYRTHGWKSALQRLADDVGLANSRRQHYGHAALLVASCVAFAPKSRAAEILRWATDLRQRYRRRHPFREELARACESLGVFMPA